MLSISELQFYWPSQSEACLQLPPLQANQGEHIGIVGDNGAGKSTLLKLIAGLLAPQQGEIRWQQQSLASLGASKRSRLVGILFQEPEQQLLHSNIQLEIELVLKQQGVEQEELNRRCDAIIEQLELTPSKQLHPLDLDAGRRRLVALAGVLVAQTPLLLLDEPSRDFDRHHLNLLERLLAERKAQGSTIISISHDLDFVARNCDRVWHLSQGQLIGDGCPKQTLSHHLLQSDEMLPAPTLWTLRQRLQGA